METFRARRRFLAGAGSFASRLAGALAKADPASKSGAISGKPAAPMRKPATGNRPILVFDINETLLDLNAPDLKGIAEALEMSVDQHPALGRSTGSTMERRERMLRDHDFRHGTDGRGTG